jgi:hypothetical protein
MARLQMRTGAVVALLLLAGCGGGGNNAVTANNADSTDSNITTTVEDVSPDSLVAPDNMTFDGDEDDAGNSALANGD